MELSNEFDVSLSVSEAWMLLTDVERIAPCMPGAELREVDGEDYKGVVKVKVGPITAQYQGTARFVEKDDASHRAVLRAEGRETRGQGNASATITAQLEPSGEATTVSLNTDLHITGKVAQFGRGVLADVSNKLIGQFVENLENNVLSGPPQPSGEPSPEGTRSASQFGHAEDEATSPVAQRQEIASPRQEVEPVDLLRVAGPPVARRIVPAVGAALAILALVALLRRLLRD